MAADDTGRTGNDRGVRFEGDWLPLAGVAVADAKALLRDAGNIAYFADAWVIGRPVGAGHVLRHGDRLGFSQRFGFKGAGDRPAEGQAEALVNAYPELLEIADRVKALGLPAERGADVMAGMVCRWAHERFGAPGRNVTAVLAEVLKRLDSLEDRLGEKPVASGAPPALNDTEEMILVALGDTARKAAAIAHAAGLKHNSHLKYTLSSLVKRGVLRTGPDGYVKNALPGQDRDRSDSRGR